MIESSFYTELENGRIRCDLCPRSCEIAPGAKGYCLQRQNIDGRLTEILYGRVAALAMDPVEKKPLYHFLPGQQVLSVGTLGCNLGCRFCQNWHLSRGQADTREMPPEAVVTEAVKGGSRMIAYTYNEPLVWYPFVLDCCKLARKAGLKNVLVTNGTLNRIPFDELSKYVDAMNIDLKGDAEFYKRLTDSCVEPVRRNIRAANNVCHVEITNLLVTGENDAPDQIRELADFIASVNPKIPVHFSRYFPNYKFDTRMTAEATLMEAFRIARNRLEFVYLGNIRSAFGNDTVCPQCETVAIERAGYFTDRKTLGADGTCGNCGYDLNIVTE